MKSTFLSRFTPSLMAPETLEAIFVQRYQLAEDLVAAIRESALTANKHFRLLVGMRGIGKTHTIALIYHRVFKMDDLRDKLLIAWLREEERGVTSFLKLLLRIFRALKEEYPTEYNAKLNQQVEALYQLSADEAEYKAAELLREFVGKRTLLLLMENLDDLFDGLGDIGQKQLRAYIQNYSFLTILATAQSLFDGVRLKDYPFYGFFYPYYLEELKLDEAIDLLIHIAKLEGDGKLESFIQTPTGRDRIQAVHHLAGGNHRVYVIFAEFLTRQLLDELVKPFMRTLDELTPYYQARMQWLSLQQQEIVEFLCDRRGAVTVKEIAQHCFITHQTASSQLKALREKGYVKSEAIGRESFYELREVLMRFCLEVKKQRNEPIQLFVEFLRIWYTRTELQQRLEMLPVDAELEREYVIDALSTTREKTEDPRVAALIDEYEAYFDKNEFVRALQVAKRLVEIRDHAWDWFNQGYCLDELGHYKEALGAYDKAIELDPNDATSWFNRGVTLDKLERVEEALASYDRAVELDPDYGTAWLNQAWELSQLGRYEEALALYDQAIKLDSQYARIWKHRGWVLSKLGRYQEALTSCKQAIQLNSNDAAAWKNQGWVLSKLGRYQEALTSCKQAIQLNPNDAAAWKNQGWVLSKLKIYEESLASWGKAIELNRKDATSWNNQGWVLSKLGRYEEALASYDQAIKREPEYSRVWNNRGWVLEYLGHYEKALEAWAMVTELNPNYLTAWNNRSWLLRQLGRYDEALFYYNKAIELGEQSSHVFFNRAEVLLLLSRWDEGIVALDDALNRFAHADEPDTGDTEAIICNLLSSSHDAAIWKSRIATLIEMYDKYQVASALGQGIVRSIPALMSEMVGDKAAQTWLEVWRELVDNRPELQIPLRLLNAAVRYRETKGDRRVLLELPIEERKLLQPLLHLEEP